MEDLLKAGRRLGNVTNADATAFIKPWFVLMEEEMERYKKLERERLKSKRIEKAKRKENEGMNSEEMLEGDGINSYGRELFIGGLDFSDLDAIKLPKQRFATRDQRRQLLLGMFSLFGKVVQVKTHWTKGFFLVIFQEPHEAIKAFETLSQHKERSKITNQMRKTLKKDRKGWMAAPPPSSYYVRWPTNNPPIEGLQTSSMETAQ
eukprot:TRINITY_DN1592_c0_g1_i1.p1 TRINITY_DN1592_c0_g1~~TRINITY_DN1592_c0_g1_i1.p1  ORF type:complete len:205 (-),score=50.10 TRINITY_DN1592_c0_g1_i1:37-651(-)